MKNLQCQKFGITQVQITLFGDFLHILSYGSKVMGFQNSKADKRLHLNKKLNIQSSHIISIGQIQIIKLYLNYICDIYRIPDKNCK